MVSPLYHPRDIQICWAAVLRHGECLTEESLYSAADTQKTPDYEREQFLKESLN